MWRSPRNREVGRSRPRTLRERHRAFRLARTIKGDRAIAFEFLRLEFRSDGIFYVAQPGGRPKTEFKLTAFDGKSATFENPQHDHPKLIRYSLMPDGSLKAELDGAEGRQAFTFKPVQR